MAELNLGDYMSLVRAFLDELRTPDSDLPEDQANTLFPDADIIAELNAVQLEVVRSLDADFCTTETVVNATATAITIPAACAGNLQVIWTNGQTGTAGSSAYRVIEHRSRKQMYETNPSWQTQTGTQPTAYVPSLTEAGFTFLLWPIMQGTVTNGLILRHSLIPTEMTDLDDTCPMLTNFPDFQRKLLPYGAMRNILQYTAGQDDDQFQKYDQLFTMLLIKFNAALTGFFVRPLRYSTVR